MHEDALPEAAERRPLPAGRPDHRETMEKMFAAVTDLYAEHWNDFFHFAIFDRDEQTWDEAFEATHRKYVGALRLQPGARVLEIACGRGGFAEFMARTTNADVLAIDISDAQLSHARKRGRPNLRFAQHDVMAVDELSETFDAVVCLDAACYFPDKRAAVEKIAHVLAPGGRLLLVDWCKGDGVNRLQDELVLQPFMKFWAIPGLETARGYAAHLERAGLDLLELDDLNDRVVRNWELAYQRAVEAVRDLTYTEAARVLWKVRPLGREAWRMVKEQFPAALYIKAAYDAGFLRYTYIVACRPPSMAGAAEATS